MKKLWVTYAWADNDERDVDYLLQELRTDLEVRVDKWRLSAGLRLWEQIGTSISSPDECDAWLIYATENSLKSESCKEELSYALDRALSQRGQVFPIIGLFPQFFDTNLLPQALKVRLCVSLRDPVWKERIVSATEGRPPRSVDEHLLPYSLKVHSDNDGNFVIEVRPRIGIWVPFTIVAPTFEMGTEDLIVIWGQKGVIPEGAAMSILDGGLCKEPANWKFQTFGNEANQSMSYFLYCKRMPSSIMFGVNPRLYKHTFK